MDFQKPDMSTPHESTPSYENPREYDSWDNPTDSFKKNAWDKYLTFVNDLQSALSVSDLLTALQKYAVRKDDELVLVEWTPSKSSPEYDGDTSFEKIKKVLEKIRYIGKDDANLPPLVSQIDYPRVEQIVRDIYNLPDRLQRERPHP